MKPRPRWPMVLIMPLLHLLGLAALLYPSPSGMLICLVWGAAAQIGLTLGYHRLFSHGSFQPRPWLRYTLAFLAIQTFHGGPIGWAAVHRKHHAHADQEGDPHSPRHNFFWAQCLWLVHEHPLRVDPGLPQRYCKDLLADRGLVALEYLHFPIVVAGAGLLSASGGLAWLLWGFFMRFLLNLHITNLVNSLCHTHGYRNYDTRDCSTNHPLVALLTFGEGWHNNHHHAPGSACLKHRWWEWDPGWWILRGMQRLGWIGELRHHDYSPRPSTPKQNIKNLSESLASR